MCVHACEYASVHVCACAWGWHKMGGGDGGVRKGPKERFNIFEHLLRARLCWSTHLRYLINPPHPTEKGIDHRGGGGGLNWGHPCPAELKRQTEGQI